MMSSNLLMLIGISFFADVYKFASCLTTKLTFDLDVLANDAKEFAYYLVVCLADKLNHGPFFGRHFPGNYFVLIPLAYVATIV